MDLKWLNFIENEFTEISNLDNWILNAYTKSKAKFDSEKDENYFEELVSENFEDEIKTFEEKKIKLLFEYLNLSILAGECFYEGFIVKLESLINHISEFYYYNFELEDEKLELSLENKLKETEPFLIFKKALVEYKSNSQFILRLVNDPLLNTLFDLSNQMNDILNELNDNIFNDDKLKKELLLVTKHNLDLFRKDFCLKYDIKLLKELLIIKHGLAKSKIFFNPSNNGSFEEIIDILIDKNQFLTRKFIIRKRREENSHNENYVFLGKEIDFSLNSHKLQLDIFKEWDQYSRTHFLSEGNDEKVLTIKKKSKTILNRGKILALDYHLLTKYYKDININIKNLYDLYKNIDNIPLSNLRYDNYSMNKIKGYIKNNIFSEEIRTLLISSPINSIETLLSEKIEIIKEDQEQYHIHNFFPYYKIVFFLKEYIEQNIEIKEIDLKKHNTSEKIKSIEKALEILKKYYSDYKQSLKWSQIHLHYSYQLPFTESIFEYDLKNGEKANIFSSSSFSLPIDFIKYEKFSNELEPFILRIENEIKSLKNISYAITAFEKDKTQLQSDINNNTKKNIELMSIFTAIIALIFGGVSTASGNSNFENKFLTFISLFIVLFSFLTLVRTFIQKEKKYYEILGLFFIYLIFLIVIISILSIVIKQNHT